VPLFVKVPGVAPARCDEPMSTLDLWPTLFALAPDVADPGFLAQCRGRNVLAKDFEAGPVFGTAARRPTIDAVTLGKWKLMREVGGDVNLFDLESDPNELKDLAATQPKIVARLTGFLDGEVALEKRWKSVHAGEAKPPTDEDLAAFEKARKELAGLGYGDGNGDR
jgi:choline-sulfatase